MHETHQTSGSHLRQPHFLNGEGLKYELKHEQRELANDVARTSAGRAAKSLAKSDTLRVTLLYVRAGTTINPAASAGAASLQLLTRHLSIGDRGADGTEVRPGEIVIFSDNLREPIQALEDSTFPVTIGWEEGAGAWNQEQEEGRL